SNRVLAGPGLHLSAAAAREIVELSAEIQVSNGFASPDQRLVRELAGILLHVAPANESDLGIEVRLDLVVLRSDQEFFISPACLETPRLISSGSARCIAAEQVTIELEFLEELEVGVGSINAVIVSG